MSVKVFRVLPMPLSHIYSIALMWLKRLKSTRYKVDRTKLVIAYILIREHPVIPAASSFSTTPRSSRLEISSSSSLSLFSKDACFLGPIYASLSCQEKVTSRLSITEKPHMAFKKLVDPNFLPDTYPNTWPPSLENSFLRQFLLGVNLFHRFAEWNLINSNIGRI